MKSYVMETDFPDLKLVKRGKVRDMYDLGDTLLMLIQQHNQQQSQPGQQQR